MKWLPQKGGVSEKSWKGRSGGDETISRDAHGCFFEGWYRTGRYKQTAVEGARCLRFDEKCVISLWLRTVYGLVLMMTTLLCSMCYMMGLGFARRSIAKSHDGMSGSKVMGMDAFRVGVNLQKILKCFVRQILLPPSALVWLMPSLRCGVNVPSKFGVGALTSMLSHTYENLSFPWVSPPIKIAVNAARRLPLVILIAV